MMQSRFSIFLFIFVSSVIASDMALLGGVRDVPAYQNSDEVESLARFAVDEHNKKEVHLSLSLSLSLD